VIHNPSKNDSSVASINTAPFMKLSIAALAFFVKRNRTRSTVWPTTENKEVAALSGIQDVAPGTRCVRGNAMRILVRPLTCCGAEGSIAAPANICATHLSEEMTMLKVKFALVFAVLILAAASAKAQTKISGTIQCAKPDQQTAIPVNDRPGHVFVVAKAKCTWTKPFEIVGVQSKTGEDTAFSEADGAKSRDTGYDVTTMANGDKFFVRFSGTSTSDKNGVLQAAKGMWSFVSGTGKLKGITGKGTFSGKGAADGSATTEVEGEYQIGGK
jgi:hypothetical protein